MFLSLLTASLTAIIISYLYFIFISKTTLSGTILLAIGILSAQENFELRNAARFTWLKGFLHNNNSIKAWFIIGKDSCLVPPEYRLNLNSCSKWEINLTNASENFYSSSAFNVDKCLTESQNVFHQGFSFKVNHPVIVKHLGVLSELLLPNVRVKVALLDIQSQEIILSTEIIKNETNSATGYIYAEVEAVLLPKHYEGMLLVEGLLQHTGCVQILWNDNGGVVTYTRIYASPQHLDSFEYSNEKFSAGSIHFEIYDFDSLKSLVHQEANITEKWQLKMEKLKEKLIIEKEKEKDILLVDVVDTYRSLPLKLLHFYKWLNHNYIFSYGMKTDDDTIINMTPLMENLERFSYFKPETFWIWSRFRKDWPVNYVGKWSDYEYRSSLYPAFPCGAAYVMSHKTISWLSYNSDYLHPYQGEDVSTGIWLSAVNPDFIDDENFECDSQCSANSYNRAQMTAEGIYKAWKNYKSTGSLCTSDLEK